VILPSSCKCPTMYWVILLTSMPCSCLCLLHSQGSTVLVTWAHLSPMLPDTHVHFMSSHGMCIYGMAV
jgi:hypothetical protein